MNYIIIKDWIVCGNYKDLFIIQPGQRLINWSRLYKKNIYILSFLLLAKIVIWILSIL